MEEIHEEDRVVLPKQLPHRGHAESAFQAAVHLTMNRTTTNPMGTTTTMTTRRAKRKKKKKFRKPMRKSNGTKKNGLTHAMPKSTA